MATAVAQPATVKVEEPLEDVYSRAETDMYIDQSVHDLKFWKTHFEKLLLNPSSKPDDPRARSLPVSGNGNIDNWSYDDMDNFFKALLSNVKAIKAISNSRNTKDARSKLNKDYLEAKDQLIRTTTDPVARKAALEKLAVQYYRLKGEAKDNARVVVGRPVQLVPNSILHRFIIYLMRFYLKTNKVMFDQVNTVSTDEQADAFIQRYFPNLWAGRMKPTNLQHLLRYVQEYPRYSQIAALPELMVTFDNTGIDPRKLVKTSIHNIVFPQGLIPEQDANEILALMNAAGVSFNEFNPTAVSSKLFKAVNPAGETTDQAKLRRQNTAAALAQYLPQLETEYENLRRITQGAQSVPNINRLLYKMALRSVKDDQESLAEQFIRTNLVRRGYADTVASEYSTAYIEAIKRMNAVKYPKIYGTNPTKEEKKAQLAALRQKGAEDYNTLATNLGAQIPVGENGTAVPLTLETILQVAPPNDIKTRITDKVNDKFTRELPILRQKYERGLLLSDKIDEQ